MLFSGKSNRGRERRRPQSRMPERQPLGQMPRAGQNRTFSYYAARSENEYNLGREAVQNKPPIRRVPTKLQRLRKRSGLLFLIVLGLILVIFEMQLSAVPKVVALTHASDAPFLRDTEVYQQAAAKLFQSSPANRNKLTVNAAAIATKLEGQFPELKDVSVALPLFGHQPVVYVQPADPALILSTQGSGTFVVDEYGRAAIKATPTTRLSSFNVPTVSDQSGLTIELGKQALAHNTTLFISEIIKQLRAHHVTPKAITLPPSSSELDVYVEGANYFIKFNLQDDQASAADVQVGSYLALQQHLGKVHATPREYVDVRLEGRAYYK